MNLPPGLTALIDDFREHGSDVQDVRLDKADGTPPPPELHPRPTGQEIFNSKSPAEQDAMLGPKAAEAIRTGAVSLDELVQREPLETDQPDFITQKPLPQEGD